MRSVDACRLLALAAALALALGVTAGALAEEPTPEAAAVAAPEAALGEDLSLKHLELRSIQYEASMGRDPFDLPDYSAAAKGSTAELDLRSALLVGIVRLPDGYIALVEDENGDSYALMKGDPVEGGLVTAIDEEALIAWMRNGDSRQQVRLELAKEGE